MQRTMLEMIRDLKITMDLQDQAIDAAVKYQRESRDTLDQIAIMVGILAPGAASGPHPQQPQHVRELQSEPYTEGMIP
jgi:hypothetical protein